MSDDLVARLRRLKRDKIATHDELSSLTEIERLRERERFLLSRLEGYPKEQSLAIRAGMEATMRAEQAEARLARVREWVEQERTPGGNWDEVLALLDGEAK